jgi:hypothetical protein
VNRVKFAASVLLACLALGCVERKLHIRTEPAGALIRVNGRDVGRSPAEWRFHHYGTVRVTAQLEGYVSQQRYVRLRTPWYEYPIADLVSDVLIPVTIKNDHHVSIDLAVRQSSTQEQDEAMAEVVAQRAVSARESMRAEFAADEAKKAKNAEKAGNSGP